MTNGLPVADAMVTVVPANTDATRVPRTHMWAEVHEPVSSQAQQTPPSSTSKNP